MSNTIKCPFCAEEILAQALKCKHCGSSLTGNPVAVPARKRSRILVYGGGFLLVIFILGVIGSMLDPAAGGGNSTLSGLTGSTEFTIRVTGTEGIPFHGSYMIMGSGSSDTKSVEGSTPQSYTATGSMVSVSFQKKDTPGTLQVEIVRNGEVIKQSSTTAAYGLVAVATN